MQKNKLKIFLKNYFLFLFALAMIFFILFFMIKSWQQSGEEINKEISLRKTPKSALPVEPSVVEKERLAQKIQTALDANSCEITQENLIKGYIKKIEEEYIIIGNTDGSEKKVWLRPDTVFVKSFGHDRAEDGFEKEIQKSDLKIFQDAVLVSFSDEQGEVFTPLIKQLEK